MRPAGTGAISPSEDGESATRRNRTMRPTLAKRTRWLVIGIPAIALAMAATGFGVTSLVSTPISAPGGPSNTIGALTSTNLRHPLRHRARHGMLGTVESVNATGSPQSFTVKTRKGTTITVDVTSATHYREPKVKSAGFSDLKAGELVLVRGPKSSDARTAKAVIILPAGFLKHPGILGDLAWLAGHHRASSLHMKLQGSPRTASVSAT